MGLYDRDYARDDKEKLEKQGRKERKRVRKIAKVEVDKKSDEFRIQAAEETVTVTDGVVREPWEKPKMRFVWSPSPVHQFAASDYCFWLLLVCYLTHIPLIALVYPFRISGAFNFYQPQGFQVFGLLAISGVMHLVLMLAAFGYWSQYTIKDMQRLLVQMVVAFFASGLIGVGLLLFLQQLSYDTVANTRPGFFTAPFYYVVWLYSMTETDARESVMEVLVGQVLGVGVFEEFVKLMVAVKLLLVVFQTELRSGSGVESKLHLWRWVVVIGFASGLGFGLAEGIHYHETYYDTEPGFWSGIEEALAEPGGEIVVANAIEGNGWPMYYVRFSGCAGCHGIWTAAATLAFFRRREHEQYSSLFRKMIGPGLVALAPGALIHGIGNTLLSMGYIAGSYFGVIAGFIWLAIEIYRMAGGPRVEVKRRMTTVDTKYEFGELRGQL